MTAFHCWRALHLMKAILQAGRERAPGMSAPVMSARAKPSWCFLKKMGLQARLRASCAAYSASGTKPPPLRHTCTSSPRDCKRDAYLHLVMSLHAMQTSLQALGQF